MRLRSRYKMPTVQRMTTVKKIGDKYTVTLVNECRAEGWECSEPPKRDVNLGKLGRNLQRAKQAVFEYAYCNEWDYYFTGTLDSSKISRDDLDSFEKSFSRWVRGLRHRFGWDIQYLIIPELHADLVNWHCHGLLRGIPASDIQIVNGKTSWARYAKRFGFNDLQPIQNHEAVSKYLTKYITKSLSDSRGVTEKEKHSYLVSRGLRRAETIKKGCATGIASLSPSFQNDYCQVWSDLDLNSVHTLIVQLGLDKVKSN